DPAGAVKIARYEVATGEWTFARYPLDAVASPAADWVGLSEITLLPDGHSVAIVERDNAIAGGARQKLIYGVDLADPSVEFKPFGETLDTVGKTLLRDALGVLDRNSIAVPDKLEGVAITTDRRVFLATDNDGVDENYGETLFVPLGRTWRAFRD
ncbi:MAG: esterase-like activity of phytase family protein, partial [Solirubrobacterales bacterium]|nr:esterase-like activity of phytase family protein [Solirubrobacterales bacterium]